MTEPLNKHIDIDDAEEVERWCAIFGCDELDLIETVMKVGDCPNVVDLFLTLNRKNNKS